MANYYLKTEYDHEGSYIQGQPKRTLYAWMNDTCDCTTIYDENGKYVCFIEGDVSDNILHAINRLAQPFDGDGLAQGISVMSPEEKLKLDLK